MGRNHVNEVAFLETERLPDYPKTGQAELLNSLSKAGLFIALEPDGFSLFVYGPPELKRQHRESIKANRTALVAYLQGEPPHHCGARIYRSLTKAGLIVSLDADGSLYVGGPDGIGKHGQTVEKCRDVLIAYLQQEQRQRVMQDLAALEDFCDTDCQYLKTFRAVNGELQRWCHAGNAAGDKRQWLSARLFSLRECPRRETPVSPPESAKERGEQEHREGFQLAWQWIQPRLAGLLEAGWTRRGLLARSRLAYPYLWGIAWSGPWQRQGLNVTLEQHGTIAFAFPNATGREVVQRARAR